MNQKTTYILFAVFVGVIVLAMLAWWLEPPAPVDERYVFPEAHAKGAAITADQIVRIEIDRKRPDEETLVFEHDSDSDRWVIRKPRELHADRSTVQHLVQQVLDATVDDKADAPGSLKDAQLDPPAAVVTLRTKDNKELKINVGAESPPGPSAVVYVTSSERPSPVLVVRRSGLDEVFKKLNGFRDPYLLAASTSDYKAVKLTLNKIEKKDEPKGPLGLTKKEEGLWQYTNPVGYDGSAEQGEPGVRLEAGKESQAGVEGLLKVLADMRVAAGGDTGAEYVEDEAADLAKYNLDPAKSDVLTIDVERVEPAGKAASSADKGKTTSVTALFSFKKVDDKATDAQYYAAVKGDKGYTVVKIGNAGPDAVALLFKDPTYLCNHNLAALGGMAPLAVDVVNADGTLSFRRESAGKDWQVYRNNGNEPIPVDQTAVSAMVNQLVQPSQVRSFLDPKSDLEKLGLGKSAPVVSIWVDGVVKEEEKKDAEKKDPDKKDDKDADKKEEKKEEKKPRLILAPDKVDKPAARLTFGSAEAEEVVVQRVANHAIRDADKTTIWTESAVVKAPKLLADQARAGALTYYDKKLPKFNEGFDLPDKDVVKLELNHDGEHYVISRAEAKPDSPWKFEEPKEMAERKVDASAVLGILSALDDLRATSLVAEAPKDDDLDKLYGLMTPGLTAVVTKKDDKNSPYTYCFGKDAPDGGVYAQQSQRPMVFVVSKATVDALKRDLRDRTIFAFDPAKVKIFKMAGWQKKSGGMVLTRDLERKDDMTWEKKAPADPNVQMSSDKVNKVVADLSKLQAERFVSRNAAIKAEYDKEEPKNAFTFEMKVEGVDAPYVLKVVDLTGDQALPEADRQVYATSPQLPGELFQVRRTIFTAPPGMPMQIGPIDEAGYFSP